MTKIGIIMHKPIKTAIAVCDSSSSYIHVHRKQLISACKVCISSIYTAILLWQGRIILGTEILSNVTLSATVAMQALIIVFTCASVWHE